MNTPYRFRVKKDGDEYHVRIWKIPHKQKAIVKVDTKEAVFKFTEAGAELIEGEKFPTDMEDTIKSAIMQYLFNRKIHK